VLGHIPCIPIKNGAADATPGPFDAIVRSYYNPLSTVAEAFRGVRAAIFAAGREKTCQVVQIASPNVGDGKTVLTVNLAVSIAQSGKRVLLVDADLRRPSVSKVLGTPLDNGFAMVLAGEIEVLDAIVPSGIPNLDVLPGCGTSRSPADLITSPNLKETIDLARERYDYVLLDTPALLAVTDGAAVAPFVDATILVVRITKNVRTFVEHALEILNTVQAQVLGIVVNTLQADNYSGLGRGYPFARFYKRDHVYFTEKSLHKAADREENGHGAPRAAKAAESSLAQQ
jgi:capsular exopolysaccharide synthesis family protein